MKSWWRQVLILNIFCICSPSWGQVRLCSQIFSAGKIVDSANLLKRVFLPNTLLRFDHELYWNTRTADLTTVHLPKEDLKRLEFKLGLLDRTSSESAKKWIEQIPQMEILRARNLTSLVSRYDIADLQNSYLRMQFITQLALLKETPWMGLKKSIEMSVNKDVQVWAQATTENRLLNEGLEKSLRDLGISSPEKLASARIYVKKFLAGRWHHIGRELPILNTTSDLPLLETLLWNGSVAQKDLMTSMLRDNYNHFTPVYKKWATAILISSLYFLIPQMQEDAEKDLLERQQELANTPEKIQERNEKFDTAMMELDKISKSLAQISAKNPQEQMYDETLELFAAVNKRPMTPDEAIGLRKKLALP